MFCDASGRSIRSGPSILDPLFDRAREECQVQIRLMIWPLCLVLVHQLVVRP